MPDEVEESGAQRDAEGKFLPGHVGIGGRPKGRSFGEEMERLLDQPAELTPGKTRREALCEKVLLSMEDAKPNDRRLLLDGLKRLWPEKLSIDLSGAFNANVAAGVGVTDDPDKLSTLLDVLAEAGVAPTGEPGVQEETPEGSDP